MGMIESLAEVLQPVLSIPFIRQVRRNHGLEHATIHLLAQGKTRFRMAGRSDNGGFFLYGDVTSDEVAQATAEALRRMRAGQHELAIHPNCGTNLLTTGVMASLASLAAMAGTTGTPDDVKAKLERFPTMVLMVILALILGPGLGTAFQRHLTTLGDPGDLEVTAIRRNTVASPLGGALTVHRVETRGG
jgi:hypothetical protein